MVVLGLLLGSVLLFAGIRQQPDTAPLKESTGPSLHLPPDGEGILYVDSAAAAGGDGSSWAQALSRLSDALQAAHSDPSVLAIHVAAGTYYPTGTSTGTNRDSTFAILRGGLRLLGGFDATSGQRDVENNRTVLSGNIGNDNDSTDNSYHVLVLSNIPVASDSIVIDGFSIREANANGQTLKKFNGLDIRQKDGGGLYIQSVKGPVLIVDCRIEQNTAQEWGGGMYLAGGSAPDLRYSSIVANYAAVGGGILNDQESSPHLQYCTIAGNTVWQNSGGGVFNNHSHPHFVNCLIVDNVSNGSTGGGGIRNFASSPVLINSVIAGNQSDNDGAGLRNNSSSSPRIINSIIWDNKRQGVVDNIHNDNASNDKPYFHNSYLQRYDVSWIWESTNTGVNGGGNLVQSQTPFADGDQSDYHLQGGSLAINGGDNDSLPSFIHLDLDGHPRIFDSIVDMGAYEYQSVSVIPDANGILYVDSAAAPDGSGASWGDALTTLKKALETANSNSAVREIRVAAGHYYPTGVQSSTDREEAFALSRGGLKLRGGYDAGSGIQDIAQHPTVLSGDIGVPGDSMDNSYHVVLLANFSAQQDSTLIEGFTITGGNGSETGGIDYNGVHIGHPYGGGMHINRLRSPLLIRQCTFYRNTTLNWGGGLYISDGSAPRLEKCIIADNRAMEAGGGVLDDKQSGPVFIDCQITGNTAVSNSGGAMFSNDSHPLFVNTLIAGNRSLGANGSGGLRNFKSPATFINCVIANNTATNGIGGGVRNNGGSAVKITNSILWNNQSMGTVENIRNDAAADWPRLAFTFLQGDSSSWAWEQGYSGIDGSGNWISNVSPFVDATSGDFHLVTGSPAINGGNNDSLPAGIEKDLAGQFRFVDGSIDMGVYEDQHGPVMVIIQPDAEGIVYVSDSAEEGGNGSSWARAANSLRQVLETANHKTAIQEIRISGGIYYPTDSLNGTERNLAFVIARGGVSVIGGYEYPSGIRKPKSQSTVLSGDIGLSGDSSDNSYHVVVIGKMDTAQAEVVLDGLTIRDGQADGSGSAVYEGQLVPRNKGAGLYLDSVLNNVIVRHTNVVHNTADSGGGLYAGNGSAPWFSQSLFSGNTALHKGGGAMLIHQASPWLINTAFYGNAAGDKGGAIYSDDNSQPTITNGNLYGNSAGDKGGALYNNAGSDVVISNTIIYGNSPEGVYNNTSSPDLSYSIIQGMTADPVNHISGADPLFMDPANNNFHVQVGSPAIDAGSNSTYSAAGGNLGADRDADGIPRVYGSAIDIGVYEFFNCPGATTLHVNGLAAAGGDGSSWGQALQTLSQALQIATFCPQVDSILVAEGTYYPTGAQNGTNRDSAFVILRGGLVVLGGYSASGSQRDPVAYETILSGNIGQLSDSLDNSFHVLVIPGLSGEEDDLLVDGFTITAGHADRNQGEGKPMNGRVVYRNNGGGIYTTGIQNKTVISESRIIGNSGYFGGGIFNIDQSSPQFVNAVIADNTAAFGGGVTNGKESKPQFVNCVLTGNTSAFEGGAIANTLNSSPDIINSTIIANHAEGKGAGIYNGKSSPVLIDPSLNNNTCSVLDMVDYTTDYSSPNISNSILWDNFNGNGVTENIYSVTTSRPVYRNSYLQGDSTLWDWGGVLGGIDSSGNIITLQSPFDDAEEDYRLDSGAWAIDAGRNDLLPADVTTDGAGGTRIVNAIVDMGALEFNQTAPIARVLLREPEDVAVCVGETAVFEAEAEGPHLHYQWQYSESGRQWRNLPRANAAKLTIRGATPQQDSNRYRMVVTSASRHDTSRAAVLIVHPRAKVSIVADRANPVPADQFVRLSVKGGAHYQWRPAPGIRSGEAGREVAIIAREAADYQVTVTDSNGCSFDQHYALRVQKEDSLGFPNILTPNGDGINDQWIVPHLEKYPSNRLEVFNRAGQLIYRRNNYANDWTGRVNGKVLPTGTYYFIFTVNNGAKMYRGYIHVIQGQPGQASEY